MRVLITGAGGMLGRAAVLALENAGHDVLPLAREDADVTDPHALEHATRTFLPDWIFHLAAFTRVDDCESQPELAHRVNALGARHVAASAAAASAAILYVSTDYVFDGTSRRPYREDDVPNPKSVYGASKWAGEQAVRELQPRHAVVRTAWLFGPGGANFVDTIRRRAAHGESLRVVSDQRGTPTYTHDLAPALIRLAEDEQFGTFHVTNAGEATWYDVAVHVVERSHATVQVNPTTSAALGRPAPRPAYSVLSNDRYLQITGERLPEWQGAVDRYLKSKETP